MFDYLSGWLNGSITKINSPFRLQQQDLRNINLSSLAALTATDDLDLPSLGERKVALFALILDNDTSYNFLVSILVISAVVLSGRP